MATLKVGFIGLGNMGMSMAKSLLRAGFSLTVYDIRPEAIGEMRTLGATGANSSREVAAASDVVISMVWDIPQTDEVIFGKNGVWEGIKQGATIIISSSIGPEYCRELYSRAKPRGIEVVDCCVTGRDPLNGNRPLTLLIGGDEKVVKHCWPVFETLGKHIFFLGGIGTGQAYKMMNNITGRHISAASRLCLIEGLNFGLKAGLDLQKMVEVMSVGASARSMQYLGLKPGLDAQMIIEVIRAPASKAPGTGPHRTDELEYAAAMAEAAGAKIPLSQFLDGLDTSSTYDAYYALLKQCRS